METTPEDKKKADKRAYMKKYRLENADRIKLQRKNYYDKNCETIKNYQKVYHRKNIDDIHKRQKIYAKDNAENIKKTRKRYNEKHSDIIKKYKTEYNKKNIESIRVRSRIYRENNREKLRNIYSVYQKTRRDTDCQFKIIQNLRARIRLALRSQSTKKSISTVELLGATKEEVWKHLESLFKEGMTRENNSPKGWHIDHIRPMSSFDLSDPTQLKECCHYTNLQPLWWWENLEKGDKIV